MPAVHHLYLVIGNSRQRLAGARHGWREQHRDRHKERQELPNAHCGGICAHGPVLSTSPSGGGSIGRLTTRIRVHVPMLQLRFGPTLGFDTVSGSRPLWMLQVEGARITRARRSGPTASRAVPILGTSEKRCARSFRQGPGEHDIASALDQPDEDHDRREADARYAAAHRQGIADHRSAGQEQGPGTPFAIPALGARQLRLRQREPASLANSRT